ncbi:MAG TPA: S1C family serine protease [Planctomycetota bacterium]|nr:S1C family serine protease [Planctomycetota bacterium]
MNALCALLAIAAATVQDRPSDDSTLRKLERDIAAVVEKVRPSVVRVTAMLGSDPLFGPRRRILSGVVYGGEGHVVTEASGVEGAEDLSVEAAGDVYKARHVASDVRTGVAVLHVPARGLVPAAFVSEPCKPGAIAVTVGYPFGAPGASFGSIAGSGRSILVGGRRYDDMIQVTAPVHPGDCGGFVADAAGRFVGLVHSLYGAEPGRSAAPGAGFAVPAEWVKFSADRIIRHGRMVRGWLGVTVRAAGRPEGGVRILRVDPDGPAARAGLAPEDVLVAFDGRPVRNPAELQWKVARFEEPTPVRVTLLRGEERLELEVRVEIDPLK